MITLTVPKPEYSNTLKIVPSFMNARPTILNLYNIRNLVMEGLLFIKNGNFVLKNNM